MNKTQRTLRLLRLLKERPRNGTELARELDVDVRTLCRYMAELRKAGYRINGKSGQRGYYEMEE
jgi:predicted DNA-binding transcriptional regulator YafY